ncbi:MAG: hypothetical protein DRJ69_02240 [Thermoprotei archaeon]|nr:MAG: hypothetical protein DRJ69_02240 [Thermoprotei archaeon]
MATVTIVLPDKALRSLKERAELEGKPLEELISESVFKTLDIRDPQAKAELHLELCEKYMREAEELLARGDHVQASEKAWSAASQMVKALAAQEGRDLKSHRELHEYLASIVERTKDAELRKTWSAAGELHRNFYEAWLPQELVKGYLEDVKGFVDKLRKLLQ